MRLAVGNPFLCGKYFQDLNLETSIAYSGILHILGLDLNMLQLTFILYVGSKPCLGAIALNSKHSALHQSAIRN